MDALDFHEDDELDYDLDANDGGTVELIGSTPNDTQKEEESSAALNISDVSNKSSSRKRKMMEKEWNESEHSSDDSATYESCHEGDEEEDKMVKSLEGRLAGRVTRRKPIIEDLKEQEEITKENTEAGEDDPVERFAHFLVQKTVNNDRSNRRALKESELEALYKSLGADPDDSKLRFNTLLVAGTGSCLEAMNTYDISRIFAEFNPETVRPLDKSAFVVTFANGLDVAQLLLDMTRPMRRVRAARKPEEGELVDTSEEEEEEGQVKEEGGEDVAVIRDEEAGVIRGKSWRKFNCRESNDGAVEVDVTKVQIPSGKWRVLIKHVPDSKLIFARLASGEELRRSLYLTKLQQRVEQMSATEEEEDEEDPFTYRNKRIRPGLNIFDDKGNELDWDYEHDTRFFEEYDNKGEKVEEVLTATTTTASSSTSESQADKGTEEMIQRIGVVSRGRGTKKFLKALMDSVDE